MVLTEKLATEFNDYHVMHDVLTEKRKYKMDSFLLINKKTNVRSAEITITNRKSVIIIDTYCSKDSTINPDKLTSIVNEWMKQDSKDRLRIINKMLEIKNNFYPFDRSVLDLPIDALELSTRPHNALKINCLNTVRDVMFLSVLELRSLHQVGEKSALEVINKMNELGIVLR